jgi:hypothetical protein
MAAILFVAGAVAADNPGSPPPNEPCARGPVTEIPESVRNSTDEQTGITWYRAKSTPDRPNEDALYLYAGKKGCDVWLRLRIQYLSEKPLTVARVQVKADDKTFDLPDPHFKRDTDGKLTWQWIDEQVTADHLLMLFTITASKTAVLRLIGTNRTDERAIIEAEKEAIKTVLSTYHALGGKL